MCKESNLKVGNKKDKIIKILAEELFNKNMCPSNCERIRQSCAFRMDVVINCWINWAERQINGT